MSTKKAYLRRIIYDEKLPPGFFNQNFIDYNTVNRYGIVDIKNNLIFPRFDKMKPFKDSGKEKLLSFVSRAYEGFLGELTKKIALGNWEKDSLFRNLEAKRAFVSPITAYDEFMTVQFQKLMPSKEKSKKNLVSIYKNRNIVDFESFMGVFEEYIASLNYNFPYTLTGFLERHNNVAFSGLQIEFENSDKNSWNKRLEYIEDPGFKRYLVLAERHGFYVNRNMPWILVANIDSIPMQKYASVDAGITIGTEGILQRYFQLATDISFDFFAKYLIGSYNSVALSEPHYSYLESSSDHCLGYKKIDIVRKPETTFDVPIQENLKLLQMLYLTIRYYECFSDRQQYKALLRKYYSVKKLKVKEYPFSELVERLVSPTKNSKILFYQVTGETIPASFEFSFQAQQAAAALGSSGAHQMPNGRWMPCNTHEEYMSLTGPSTAMPKKITPALPVSVAQPSVSPPPSVAISAGSLSGGSIGGGY